MAREYEWLDDHSMQIELWDDTYTTDGPNIIAEDAILPSK